MTKIGGIHFKATVGIRGINPFVKVTPSRAVVLKPGWRSSSLKADVKAFEAGLLPVGQPINKYTWL